jgi:hypothetical protein
VKSENLTIFILGLITILRASDLHLTEGNIEITYPKSALQLERYTLNILYAANSEYSEVFGPDREPLRFKIFNSRDDFLQATASSLPDWANAVTLFPQKIVLLKTPDLNQLTLREYRQAVRHELVHLRQGGVVPLNLTPTWFNEGLAVYLAGETHLTDRILLSKAITQNRIIPLSKLSDFLKYNRQQASLAYIESTTVIEFLVQVYGFNILPKLFQKLAANRSYDQSLFLTTGIELGELDSIWQKYILKCYRWIFLLDIQNMIWLIIPLLAVIVYFIKVARNKTIIQQWNNEEIISQSK